MGSVQSDAIRKLLQAQQESSLDDGSGDVVFAMFLEPQEVESHGIFDQVVNYVINRLQPSPVMVHCELVVPCSPSCGGPVNFATYIGRKSGWQVDQVNNQAYYLGTTANKWRAVPVFGKHAARKVRRICEQSQDVEYSLLRYITAAWGMRKFAALVPDRPKEPAHCATLTARILRNAISGILRHPSAWYGPSTLYRELCDDLRSRSITPDSTDVGSSSVSLHVDRLLRHRDEDVSVMRYDDAMNAIRVLTLKTSAAEVFNDSVMSSMSQKQLANALFRWSVLRPMGANKVQNR